MDVMTALMERRSIRKFTDADVSDDLIKQILEAAMMAPSAGNAQPWQFVVVRDKDLLGQIKALNPNAAMAEKAPVSILVCGDLTKEKYPGFWVQDCSAAIQNLLLAVHGLGLGAVWTGVYPKEERVDGFRKLFNLPEPIIPVALIPIGYPDQSMSANSRYDAGRVHQNQWNG